MRYFAQKYARRMDQHIETIPSEAMEALAHWPWPGNVRELENFIERAVILTRGPVLQVPMGELRGAAEPAAAPSTLAAAEREHILRVLRETNWRDRRAQGRGGAIGDEADHAAIEDAEAGDRARLITCFDLFV